MTRKTELHEKLLTVLTLVKIKIVSTHVREHNFHSKMEQMIHG